MICLLCRCQHCQALLLPSESPQMCCRDGLVDIPCLEPAQPEIMHLLATEKGFLDNVVMYNNMLAFTSMGCHSADSMPSIAPHFKLQGALHHFIGPLRGAGYLATLLPHLLFDSQPFGLPCHFQLAGLFDLCVWTHVQVEHIQSLLRYTCTTSNRTALKS